MDLSRGVIRSFVLGACLVAPGARAQIWQHQGSVGFYASALITVPDGSLLCAGSGLWRSVDGGQHWSYVKADTLTVTVAPGYKPFVFDVASGASGAILMAFDGVPGSLARSTDFGSSWSYCTPSPNHFDLPVSVDIGADGTFYALHCLDGSYPEENGIYRSTDAGAHWARTSLAADTAFAIDDILTDAIGVIYAVEGVNKNPGPWRLYRSNDQGAHWSGFDIGHQPFAGYPVGRDIWADGAGHVVVGCYNGIASSADWGSTWSFWTPPIPLNPGDAAYGGIVSNSQGILFAGFSGFYDGVVWSGDHGRSWYDYSAGLPVLGASIQYRTLAVDASDNLYVSNSAGDVFRTTSPNVAVEESAPSPAGLRFVGVAPDPVASSGELRFSSHGRIPVRVRIFDLTGRTIATSTEFPSGDGPQRMSLDSSRWRPGLYFVSLSSGRETATGRVVVTH